MTSLILTYQPEGSDEPKVWTISLGKFRSGDMRAIEDVTKMAFGTEFKQALYARNSTARGALLWTMLRKDHAALKFKDVDFADDELEIELDKDEWAALRDEAAKNTATPSEVLAAIDGEIEAAPDAPGKAPTPSLTSETSTD